MSEVWSRYWSLTRGAKKGMELILIWDLEECGMFIIEECGMFIILDILLL